jgi:hypothetical protein
MSQLFVAEDAVIETVDPKVLEEVELKLPWLVPTYVTEDQGETVVQWTPALAKYVLSRHNMHENQRNQAVAEVFKLARVMKAKAWIEEHRATWIVFDTDGNIINGQHTLAAMVEAKATLKIRTAWGDDPAAIADYDNFRPRSTGYLVGAAGYEFTSIRCAFTRLRLIIDKGLAAAKVSREDVEQLTAKDRLANQIIQHMGAKTRQMKAAGFPPAIVTYAAWRVAKVHGAQSVLDFIDSALSGANLGDTDQRLQLIRQFRAGSWNQQSDRNAGVALFITAWNNHRAKSSAKLRLKSAGTIPEVNP